MTRKRLWTCNNISEIDARRISDETNVPTLLVKVLLNRGIDDCEKIRRFIDPSLEDLNNPFLMKDMDKAVKRVKTALANKEKIVIYGDYDVDGITSTSILIDFLSRLGATSGFYIPDRVDEGYGISIAAVDKIRQMGPSLIITADCGITAVDEVKYIKECGMDIIITDHHECTGVLPDAYAVVNPHRPDCAYPFKELAGVGVVYKLIHALCIEMSLGDIYQDYVDLVTLGTVADVVPLVEENRIIVKYGIPKIENTLNIGLKALINNSGLEGKKITSSLISFVLAPRINAAGRLGDAGRGVRLFTTKDEKEAFEIALELNEENRNRQDMESQIFSEVINVIETKVDLDREKVIVAAGESWHHGVIGIVASKVTERYYRPCLLLSVENGMCKGSGRSIEGFNLFEALKHCSSLLTKYGGHELAAGLSLEYSNLEPFKRMINEYADSVLKDEDLIPRIRIDAVIDKHDINMESVKALAVLAPFGAGNPEPVFSYDKLRISDIRTVGEDRHLKLWLQDNGFYTEAIGFNMGTLVNEFNTGDLLDVAFSLEINTWNSNEKIQFNLKDIKLNKEVVIKNNYYFTLDKYIENEVLNGYNKDGSLLKIFKLVSKKCFAESDCPEEENMVFIPCADDMVPDRQDLAAVYLYIKANCAEHLEIRDLSVFAGRIANGYKIKMNYFKVKKCIEIFEELKLLKAEPFGEYGMLITLNGNTGKKDLDNSSIFKSLQALKKSLGKLKT
ncbi:MAG TPA: single-stranded-DNA-specific exonuclease RecJ [Clostridiaceae bacterium]|nr:single-stranded-DNA-specific exonuclease RecJ [Clostridiaceae bacterium]